jgi:hypothetical protein
MQKIAKSPGLQSFCKTSIFKFFVATSALLVIFGLLSPSQLRAQLVTGDILGTVTDSTGAVIPDAKVTVHNTGTGYTRSVESSKAGEYTFTQLQIGTYKVTVEAKGFKTFSQTGLVLAAGDRARVNAAMTIGNQVETVEIEATAAPALKTDSSTQDTLITTTAVADLPLNGRNLTNLVQLSAGVTAGAANAPGGAQWTGGHTDDLRQTSAFSANGQNDTFNNQMIDGMDNNERSIGTQVVKPSMEATDQVVVMTNNYPAEYGRTVGGMMNVITKSGTNQFHGSLFEYLRNDSLDAYNPNLSGGSKSRGELRQNQFGGSFGGAVIKNKTFFFGDYEGFRMVNGLSTVTATVPTSAQRNALSGATAGTTYAIPDKFFSGVYNTSTDPGTQTSTGCSTAAEQASNAACGTFYTTPTALGLALYQMYPVANQTGTTSSSKGTVGAVTSNYSWTPATRQNSDTYDARVDQHFSDKNLLFGRFSYNKTSTQVPAGLPAVTIGGKSYQHASNVVLKTDGVGLDFVHTFNANLILELKAGYNRFDNAAGINNGTNAATELGFNGCGTSVASASNPIYCINYAYGGASQGIPSMGVEDYANLGDGMWGPLTNTNQTFQYMGSLTWNHNAHSIKGGLSLIRRQMSRVSSPSGRGSFSNNAIWTGSSLADMLMGISSSVQQQTVLAFPNFRAWEAGGFVQDDWRFRPWLTFNIGVRYDLYTPYTDKHGQFSNFNTDLGILRSPSLLGIYKGTNTDDITTDYSNIAPRLGFSASLAHNVVVRGGFGMTYFTNEEGGGTVVSMANFPFTWSQDSGGDNYKVNVPVGMSYDQKVAKTGNSTLNTAQTETACSSSSTAYNCALDMQAGVTEPYLDASTVTALPSGTEIDAVSNKLKSGRLVQYSLEIQKQIGNNVVAVGYIGNAGRHMPWVPNANQATYASYNSTSASYTQEGIPYTASATLDGQDLSSDSIFVTSSASNSNYNAFQATFTRRPYKGLSASLNYTWSKAMNNGSPQGEGGNRPIECVRSGCLLDMGGGTTKTLAKWQDYDWGVGDLDTSQRFTGMVSYALPFGKNLTGPLSYVAKGWNLNAVATYDTGLPESIAEQGSTNISGITGWRGGDAPNVVAKIKGPKTRAEWFNTDAFAAQTKGLLGNAQRNIMFGAHQRTFDLSASKDIPVYEQIKLQFRAESFNTLNMTNLGLPGSSIGSSTFGQITSANGNPRLFQFALRLSF